MGMTLCLSLAGREEKCMYVLRNKNDVTSRVEFRNVYVFAPKAIN